MKNEHEKDQDQDQQEMREPELEVTDGGLIGNSPLLQGKLADPRPSPVLLALGLGEERVRRSIRFGVGRFNEEAEVDRVAARVIEEVHAIRNERAAPSPARRD